ncbi:MAG: metal ABC transporter ATP-binding protein [Phycisphaerales bacterium]|nr:metal ABC transporter ATP-binding protein [Phycisphaerales bacterium]
MNAITVEHVDFSYVPGEPVLRDISFTVAEGERLGILGPNGGGKSTLLKCLLGLLEPDRGTIRLFDRRPEESRHLVGYVAQRSGADTSFPLSVRQVVAMGGEMLPRRFRAPDPRRFPDVDDLLRIVGMQDRADAPIGALSGGQVQRVMIARALAMHPRLMVFDEPTVGIDMVGQKQFAGLLDRIHALGTTIVIVSHELRTIATACDRVACLHRSLHVHQTRDGLTPQVLAELFSHDLEGLDVHVHAHHASDCPDHHAQPDD